MKPFDFERWKGVIDEDNHADDYYEEGDYHVFCWSCGNLMVPTGGDHFKCPICGEEWDE